MLDTNRQQHFKKVLHDLLSSQAAVAVLKIDNENAAKPHCFIRATGPDKYEAIRGDSGPIVSATGKHTFTGECEFAVYARFAITSKDVAGDGTLEDEGARITNIIENAIKYGGTVDPFTTDDYRLDIREVMPDTSMWWALDREMFGMAMVAGKIRYKQTDL